MGDRGSMIVELAASWAIVMIVTGLYLWWPRQANRLAGVLYVRLSRGKRIFWRDLHAVTGVWIFAFALFLLFTGLPWASSWGKYLEWVRSLAARGSVAQDWTTGRSSKVAKRVAMNSDMPGMKMDSQPAEGQHASIGVLSADPYAPLGRVIATVAPLNLAYPVTIHPPHSGWRHRSSSHAPGFQSAKAARPRRPHWGRGPRRPTLRTIQSAARAFHRSRVNPAECERGCSLVAKTRYRRAGSACACDQAPLLICASGSGHCVQSLPADVGRFAPSGDDGGTIRPEKNSRRSPLARTGARRHAAECCFRLILRVNTAADITIDVQSRKLNATPHTIKRQHHEKVFRIENYCTDGNCHSHFVASTPRYGPCGVGEVYANSERNGSRS